MKRIITFIQKVVIFKIIGINSPTLELAGVNTKKQPLKWYWKQSKTLNVNGWQPFYKAYESTYFSTEDWESWVVDLNKQVDMY